MLAGRVALAEGRPPRFGELLRRHRLAARLTQEALASRAHLSPAAIGALERGLRRHPYMATVDVLADVLRLEAGERATFAAAARGLQRTRRRSPAAGPAPDLPTPLTPLIGREQEVRTACDLLRRDHVRLVTLTGSPGVGKSRMALEVVRALALDFAQGVHFVPLASLTDHRLLIPAIGRVLRLREAEGSGLFERLVAQIGAARMLLLLDNVEQLLDAAPALADLLARCPRLHLLVTSRSTLRLRGEHQLSVPPLRVPREDEREPEALAGVPSVALFVQRAAAAAPGFAVDAANAPVIGEVCRRLEGNPLALELAAPWVRLLPLDALLGGPDDHLRVLVGGPSDVPAHQRTMRATLDWSYGLLSGDEQVLLRRLSVFAGGAPEAAIETVCRAAGKFDGPVLDVVTGLVDKSLVRCEATLDGLRVGMLATVRAYGRELLGADGESNLTTRAHAAYYLELAHAGQRGLKGHDQGPWLERLEREHDNLRAVLDWARAAGELELGLTLAGHLWRFWERHGHTGEGVARLDELLAEARDVSPATRALALTAAGRLSSGRDHEGSVARSRTGLALARELGNGEGIGHALNNLGLVAQARNDFPAAVPFHEEALAIFRQLDDDQAVAMCKANLGASALAMGDLRRASELLVEANDIRRRVGDRLGLARSLLLLSAVLQRTGHADRGSAHIAESMELSAELGDEATLAQALVHRAEAAFDAGQLVRAREDYEEAVRMAQRAGAPRTAALGKAGLAAVARVRRGGRTSPPGRRGTASSGDSE